MKHSGFLQRPYIEWLAIPVGPTGGNIERYALWVKHINRARYRIALTYLVYPWPGEDVMRGKIGNDTIELTSIRSEGWTRYAVATAVVIRRWHRSMPQLVHSFNAISDLIAVTAKRILRSKVPIVSIMGGTRIVTTPLRKGVYKRLHDLAKNDISLFLTVSEYDKRELVNQYHVPGHKVLVHRIGIDFSQFRVNEDRNPAQPFTFGFAGRFSAAKGLIYLLEAMQMLVDRTGGTVRGGLPFRLLLAGDGRLRTEIQQRAQAAGIASQVGFLGWVYDISEFLNQVHVLVLPSLWEGTPRIILEAFYHYVPVIATNVGGVSEIIEHGKTGFLVPARSADALAETMELALNNRALVAEMGAAARRYVVEHHSIENSMSHIEHLYDRLLESGQ